MKRTLICAAIICALAPGLSGCITTAVAVTAAVAAAAGAGAGAYCAGADKQDAAKAGCPVAE